MKNIFYFLLFILFGVVLTSADSNLSNNPGAFYEPQANQVVFYENSNFGGEHFAWNYDKDLPNFKAWYVGSSASKTWNDQVSSLKVGKNVRITFWKDANYSGASLTFEGDGTNTLSLSAMPSGWNDNISSAQVRQGIEPQANQVIFYEHSNFGGNSFFWNYDRDAAYLTSYNMGSSSKTWNDQISSVKVGKNVCVTLWMDTNFVGSRIPLQGNGTSNRYYHNMPSGWNDKVSSLKIRMTGMCATK